MTHQEIFRRLSSILEEIEQNKVGKWTEETPDEPQDAVLVTKWKQELEELANEVRDNIK
jgi:hypothetical protein